MNAVGGIELKPLPHSSVVHHLVDIGRAESLAGIAVFLSTAVMANVEIANEKVGWLVFFMLSARKVNVRDLVERQLSVRLEQLGLGSGACVVIRYPPRSARIRLCWPTDPSSRVRP